MSWLPSDPEARVYGALFILFMILFLVMTGSTRRAWDVVEKRDRELIKTQRGLSNHRTALDYWRTRAQRAEMALWSTDLSAPRHDSYLTDGSGGAFQHREPTTREPDPPAPLADYGALREQLRRDQVSPYASDLDAHFASTPAASATTTAPIVTSGCTCRWGDASTLWDCPVHAVRPPINGAPLVDGDAT